MNETTRVLTLEPHDPDPELLQCNRCRAAIRHVLERIPFGYVERLFDKLNTGAPVLFGTTDVVRRVPGPREDLTAAGVTARALREDMRAGELAITFYGDPLVEALPDKLANEIYLAIGVSGGNPLADQAIAEAVLVATYAELGVILDRGDRFAGMSYRQAVVEISREALTFELASLRLDCLDVSAGVAACILPERKPA